MEEQSRDGGGGCRSPEIRRKPEVTGTKLAQALGRPLYLFDLFAWARGLQQDKAMMYRLEYTSFTQYMLKA